MAADGLRNALPGLSAFPPLPIELKGARFGVQVFTSNGTFQRPSGVSSVTAMAICVGGGGGGGGGYGNSAGTIAGGGSGSSGGASSIGSLASASGGLGGDGGTASAPNEQGVTGYQRGSFGRYARSESSPNVSWVGSPTAGGGGFLGLVTAVKVGLQSSSMCRVVLAAVATAAIQAQWLPTSVWYLVTNP